MISNSTNLNFNSTQNLNFLQADMRRRTSLNPNMLFVRGQDGVYRLQPPPRRPSLQEQLVALFQSLGADYTGQTRNNKPVNPITNRVMTIRNEADLRRLHKRMLARTRYDRAVREQQARQTRAENVLRSSVLRFRRQRELNLNASTSTRMSGQRTEVVFSIPPSNDHAALITENPQQVTTQFLMDELLPVLKKRITSEIEQQGPQKIFVSFEFVLFFPQTLNVRGAEVDVSPHQATVRNNGALLWNNPIIDSAAEDGLKAMWFSTPALNRVVPGSIDRFLRNLLRDAITSVEGWFYHVYCLFMGFRKVTLVMNNSNPIAGAHVQIPKWLANKKAVLNIQNQDNRCFGYALAAAKQQLKKDRPERPALYEPEEHVTIPAGCSYPVGLADIKRWEHANKMKISVYTLPETETETDQSHKILPLHVSNAKHETSVQLLEHKGHYMWIKNWDFLFSTGKERKYVCKCCLQSFTRKDCLENHVQDCGSDFANKEQMPSEDGNLMQFKGPKLSQVRHPVVIYYDFESILKKVERETEQETDENGEMSWTQIVHEHVPISWRIRIECSVPLPFDIDHDYVGIGAATEFVRQLMHIEDLLHEHLFPPSKKERERFESEGGLLSGRPAAPMIISPEQEADFQAATCCHLCGGDFDEGDINLRKVRDHDHYTGLYRGCAHSCCNLHLVDNRQARSIPVIAHFGSRYDTHLIIKEAYNVLHKKDKLDVLATNSEQFKTFSIRGLKFLDSGAFLSASLAKILESMSDDQKPRLRSISPEHFDLVKAKGLFPYEWFDDEARLDDEVPLDKDAWWSNTRLEGISDEDLELVQRVIKAFDIKTFREWHDLYLRIDVYGLADAFESFRDFSLREWGLDPVGYLGLPGLAWDGLKLQQKKKGAKPVELLTDPEMYRFCERGIRGGICHVAKRYSKSEMPELPGWEDNTVSEAAKIVQQQVEFEALKAEHRSARRSRDSSTKKQAKMQKQSLDLDANNLYGYAMIQKLPHSDFAWVEDSDDLDYIKDALKTYSDDDWENSDQGFIVEVDLEYPKEKHDAHSDYPLAPERLCVDASQVSSYCREYNTKFNRTFTSSSKLMCHLGERSRYVIHAKTLGLYLRLGMKLKRIHRALSFHQEPWMADWINGNTAKRAKAQTDFEKDLFKLANNACFGKTMENVRGRMNLKLCCDPTKYKRYINRVDYLNDFQIAGDEENALMAVNLREKVVKLDKPIFAGLAVLDLSKHWMYHSYYNVFKPMFGPTMRLGATDTDSFMIDVTGDVDKIIWANRKHFDLSNYPEDHPLYDLTNKKVLGKFKNELAGEIIAERVNLRAKLYSFNVYDPETGTYSSEKRCKGISQAVVKKAMHFDDYKQTLMEQSQQYRKQYMLRSKNHTIYTVCINKVALSSYDDKRYILDGGLDSLAYGHWRIEEERQKEKMLRKTTQKLVDEAGGIDKCSMTKRDLRQMASKSLGYEVGNIAFNRMLELSGLPHAR